MNSCAALSTPTLTGPGARVYGGAADPPDGLTDEIRDRWGQ
ncbi:Uncharacterised protein [Mycobacterium tuberculosis]|nr:Uncharacterised protein [Mycobacterium tuberculosis]